MPSPNNIQLHGAAAQITYSKTSNEGFLYTQKGTHQQSPSDWLEQAHRIAPLYQMRQLILKNKFNIRLTITSNFTTPD